MWETQSIKTEPYIKYYSPDEINNMCLKVAELLASNKKDEADFLSNEIPLLPKSAEIWKRLYGVEDLISSGVNLYEVVQEYGIDWLKK